MGWGVWNRTTTHRVRTNHPPVLHASQRFAPFIFELNRLVVKYMNVAGGVSNPICACPAVLRLRFATFRNRRFNYY